MTNTYQHPQANENATRPEISFAIPLYNKRDFILENVNKIGLLCDGTGIDYEILITDNASTDLPIPLEQFLADSPYHERVTVYRHPCTISSGDNWIAALTLCRGDVIKLQLADDYILPFDIKGALAQFKLNPDLDYLIGKSSPAFRGDRLDVSTQEKINKYYQDVNSLRRDLSGVDSRERRIELLFRSGFFNGHNSLGDINSLLLARQALTSLREPIIKGLSPFYTWADWEILLKAFLSMRGVFWDEFISEFCYNDSSTFNQSLDDSLIRISQLECRAAQCRFSYIIDPYFITNIYPLLTADQRDKLIMQALVTASQVRQSSGPYDIIFDHDYRAVLGAGVKRIPDKIKQSLIARAKLLLARFG